VIIATILGNGIGIGIVHGRSSIELGSFIAISR